MPGSILWVGYPKSYTTGRARPVQFVVLHYTAGSEGPTSSESGATYDKNRTDGTSTHYFVDSSGPALQEVPDGDRSHAARFHGNEIGIQIEICGTLQTRAQWLDATSYPTLQTTAWLTATLLKRHNLEFKRLTTAEVRAAYYNAAGSRPTGICDHNAITLAFPEDLGTHTDVGPEFPWDVFMSMVQAELNPIHQGDDMPQYVIEDIGTGQVIATNGVSCWPVGLWKDQPAVFGATFPTVHVSSDNLEKQFGPKLIKYQEFIDKLVVAVIEALPPAATGGLTVEQVAAAVRIELDRTKLTSIPGQFAPA